MLHSLPDEEMAATQPDRNHTETSPLLQSRRPETAPRETRNAEQLFESGCNVTSANLPTTWQRETKTLVLWSMPVLAGYLLQRSLNLASVFVVGRLGPTELGAVSLASITTNLMGNTMIQGLANGLDTLAAQAYGSGKMHLLGLHMQRMIFFILLCSIPLMMLWWNADKILVLIVPELQVVLLAGLYLKIMILRVPAFVLFECGKRFLQAQGIFRGPTYVLLVVAPANVILMWMLVWRFGWGFVGAPIAIALSENVMAILLFAYMMLIDGSQCWGGLSRQAFCNWGPMIRLAVPGMVMQVTEYAAEEVLTVAAARFGTAQLAAQSSLLSLTQICWTAPAGLSIAVSIRAANWIGAGAIDAAKSCAKTGVVLGLMISCFNTVILASLRYQIPLLFTRDAEIMNLVGKAIPVIIILQTFDTMTGISHGLLRGLGGQRFGGYLNLIVYYMIAIPLAFFTAFVLDWQVYGLWCGITVGLCIVSVAEFWWLYRSDWNDAVEKAALRNGSD